jgi:hypothetical protein
MTMTAASSIDDVPLERVETQILTLSGQLAAGQAELLLWLAAYDRREGWSTWGCKSCAHWLSWKCGDSLHTAREKVRVARSLESLPSTAAAFGRGELSYSKVRALSRIATTQTEQDLLVMAAHETGAGVDRIVAGVRSALDTAESEDDAARHAWYSRRVEHSGGTSGQRKIQMVLPVDSAEIVYAAIEATASAMVDDVVDGSRRTRRDVIAEHGGIAAIRADALVQICEQILSAMGSEVVERGDVGRLSMVVEPDALAPDSSGDSECTLGGKRVAREAARRWGCDVRIDTVVEQAGAIVGERHGRDIGRASRVVPRRLRRAMLRRDHDMCRFPGCGATTWLHAHHIQHWAEGGPTDLNNLVSVCSFHHHLVHEAGFNVTVEDHRVDWTGPDDEPLLSEPLEGNAEKLQRSDIGPHSIQSSWANTRPDHDYVISVITARCRRATRPSRRGSCVEP